MIFQITEEHKRRGEVRSCSACPVALCIQDTMGDPLFQTDGEVVTHPGYSLWIYLPEKVREWTLFFDSNKGLPTEDMILDDPDPHIPWIDLCPPMNFELPLDELVGKAYTHHPKTGLPFIEHYKRKRADVYLDFLSAFEEGILTESDFNALCVAESIPPGYSRVSALDDYANNPLEGEDKAP